ncbi:hypothetical protein THASP1DRAFT_21372 [Thamnocephalis sphaerospora]|uniref:MCM10 OB-fold domain-containing protein n=1 Tax=Thamnocephalis sphaerospora TaxID=78915 RepID=A0A4V1IXG5_9FUNG|nr:hypothetical protein THASP1DRAFT_21372 [Thamnocephalis sphaerospora]|eukprot:RKP10979.1 hypothetical protein THASP1DRAFT_21372 [Thamnocephalis sphaerospora]
MTAMPAQIKVYYYGDTEAIRTMYYQDTVVDAVAAQENRASAAPADDIEPNSKLRIRSRLVSNALLAECLLQSRFIPLQWIAASRPEALCVLRSPTAAVDDDSKDVAIHSADWITIGVVAERPSVKTARSGKRYCTLQLADLRYANVVAVLNARLLDAIERYSAPALSLENPDHMLKIGDSIDFGRCTALRKDDTPCNTPIDLVSQRMEIAVGGSYIDYPKRPRHQAEGGRHGGSYGSAMFAGYNDNSFQSKSKGVTASQSTTDRRANEQVRSKVITDDQATQRTKVPCQADQTTDTTPKSDGATDCPTATRAPGRRALSILERAKGRVDVTDTSTVL